MQFILKLDKSSARTEELKTAIGHLMPPQQHLSDIRCSCFQHRRWHGKQKNVTNERTNEGVTVGCWKIMYTVRHPQL